MFALGKRNLLVLSLAAHPAAGQPYSGSFARVQHFEMNDTDSFSHIHGGSLTEPIVSSAWQGNVLSISAGDRQKASDRENFLFTLKDATHARLQYAGMAGLTFNLVRAHGPQSVATDWDETKTYSPEDGLPSNPEMKRIFDEDQHARQPGFQIDWQVVNKSDADRRRAVAKLLEEGALHSGEDFTWAAFVFQHGSTPDDYLLAHTLALIALKKDYGAALWIATATLDRYLQAIHQPQIYGTQFRTENNQPTTQEPYNRTLISDALRRELHVPVKSAQEEQRKQYDKERGLAK